MSDQSHFKSCLNSYAVKTFVGAGAGFLVSTVISSKKIGFWVFLLAGVGGGIASRDCHQMFNRLKINANS